MKLVLVGDSNVGKTNIVSRFVRNRFSSETRNTIGVDFSSISLDIDGKAVKVQIWDTAGQEKYKAITNSYYKNCQGAILVFDITMRSSFENLSGWMNEIRKHSKCEVPIIILGNKIDLETEREVSEGEARQYSQTHGYYYMEVSAKKNEKGNVREAIMKLIGDVLKMIVEREKKEEEGAIRVRKSSTPLPIHKLIKKEEKTKKGCC